jgi:outer membrane protein TolC
VGRRILAWHIAVLTTLALGLPAAMGAAENPTPSVAELPDLSVEEAILRALRDNPQLRLFRAERAVAAGQIVTATALNNPSLSIDALHVQAPDKLGVEFNLRWTPPQPVEWLARRSQAQARQVEVNYQVAEQEWAIATEVRIAHATLLELQEQRRMTEAAMQLRQRLLTAVQKRVTRGAATRLEQNLVDLAMMYAQRELDELDVRMQQAASALSALLGVVSPKPIGVRGALLATPTGAAAASPEALTQRAMAARPALHAAHERINQRLAAIRVEKARRYPWLGLRATYRENNLSSYPHDLQLGVELLLPVLNTNAGPLQVAQAELVREQASVLALVQDITLRVYAACAELNVRRSILLRFAKDVLPSLQEHERLLGVAARGAEIDLVALLSGEEAVLRRRRDHSDARLAYQRALLTLQAAVGTPLSEGQP